MPAKPFLILLALLVPAPALAQAAAPSATDFGGLWTGWSSANREAVAREQQGRERVRRDLATADQARRELLGNRGRALGERVGEIVRAGDCAEGERLALEARDYALTEAVRAYCRLPK